MLWSNGLRQILHIFITHIGFLSPHFSLGFLDHPHSSLAYPHSASATVDPLLISILASVYLPQMEYYQCPQQSLDCFCFIPLCLDKGTRWFSGCFRNTFSVHCSVRQILTE